MAISASIDITLNKINREKISTFNIVKELIDYGWEINHNDVISYQQLGAKDITPWINNSITIEELQEIMVEKDSRDEINGIMMTWQQTEFGGDFLFWSRETSHTTFSLNFNAFRPMINLQNNYEIIDFQWYLKRLLPCLDASFGVESFSFEQHR